MKEILLGTYRRQLPVDDVVGQHFDTRDLFQKELKDALRDIQKKFKHRNGTGHSRDSVLGKEFIRQLQDLQRRQAETERMQRLLYDEKSQLELDLEKERNKSNFVTERNNLLRFVVCSEK